MPLASRVDALAAAVAAALKARQGPGFRHDDGTLPTGAFAQTGSRRAINSATHAPLATGRMQMQALGLRAGDVVTSVSILSGTVAGATLTRTWLGLYDASRNKLAVTAEDTSATWPVNTLRTFTFTTPYTVPATGTYYLGLVVVGTTMPNLLGNTAAPNVGNFFPPIQHGTSSTGLTTAATAPATAAAITATNGWYYAYVS